MSADAPERTRLDRWLWAARLFKTRAQAKNAIDGGHVHLEGARVKPSREVHQGMTLRVRNGYHERVLVIDAVSDKRGPAKIAQTLYHETAESMERRLTEAARRKMERAGLQVPDTRPNKRDRRRLVELKQTETHPPDSGAMSDET